MQKWYKNYDNALKDAELENCTIVSASNGGSSIYYLVPCSLPSNTIWEAIAQSHGNCSGKQRMNRVIYKDLGGKLHVIDQVHDSRIWNVTHNRVAPENICSYLYGYYSLREETSEQIRIRKEKARISHEMCDLPGKEGHEIRQEIRHNLRLD